MAKEEQSKARNEQSIVKGQGYRRGEAESVNDLFCGVNVAGIELPRTNAGRRETITGTKTGLRKKIQVSVSAVKTGAGWVCIRYILNRTWR